MGAPAGGMLSEEGVANWKEAETTARPHSPREPCRGLQAWSGVPAVQGCRQLCEELWGARAGLSAPGTGVPSAEQGEHLRHVSPRCSRWKDFPTILSLCPYIPGEGTWTLVLENVPEGEPGWARPPPPRWFALGPRPAGWSSSLPRSYIFTWHIPTCSIFTFITYTKLVFPLSHRVG